MSTEIHLGRTASLYTQEPDCCSEFNTHELRVRTEDGGGGPFLVIETKRWAIGDNTDIDILAVYLKRQLAFAEQIHRENDDRNKVQKERGE